MLPLLRGDGPIIKSQIMRCLLHHLGVAHGHD